jgi:SAM-dependent methyltransferase
VKGAALAALHATICPVASTIDRLRCLWRSRRDSKLRSELAYWEGRRTSGGALEGGVPFYEWAFTEHFGLDASFYRDKRLLDIGCGPRGSLEWATQAVERVGIDPLADRYSRLRSRPHAMTYVTGVAEEMPFPDNHFDVVSTINSLDHVDDVQRALCEIRRVVKPDGVWLLLVDVGHGPTVTEPHRIGWDLIQSLTDDWQPLRRQDYERPYDNLYDNIRAGEPYDHDDPRPRPAVVSAVFATPRR